LLAFATVAPCQEVDDAVELEDLGFDSRLFSAARPAALAGAYTAAGMDVHSLVYNPAGLSHLRRIETAMGFQYEKTRVENTFYGSPSDVDQTSTNLDYLSIAYPFPTYRGSLVGALGIYREYSSYLDLINRGSNTDTFTNDDYMLQQSGSIFSYNIGCALDLSPTLSIGATFFILDGTVNALTQWSYENQGPLGPDDVRRHFLLDDLEVDTDGYGGRIGLQYFPHNKFRFGAAMSTPVWINLSGGALSEETIYLANDLGSFESSNFVVDLDLRLPYRIDAGICYTPGDFLFAFDIGYADWSQSSINKVRLRDANLKPVQREIVDIRIGVEYSIPSAPVWTRAGYAYVPYSLSYLQADRIDGTKLTKASIDKEKQIYSFGIGGLIGRVLTLDAAYQYISGERSISSLEDARIQHRMLLSASYRF
jgi:long-subunit fatty acid transport protein